MKYKIEAMPHIVPRFNPDWAKTEDSISEKLKQLKKNGSSFVTSLKNTGHSVFVSKEFKNSFYIEEDGILIYFLLLDFVDFKFDTTISSAKITSLSQANVWRNKSRPGTTGIVSEVFDYLYHKNKSILSDSIQSWDGFNFWHREILYSIEKNRYVYVAKGYTLGHASGKQTFTCLGFRRLLSSKELKSYISEKYFDNKDKLRFLILDKPIKQWRNLKYESSIYNS